jgi:hypothetical protein
MAKKTKTPTSSRDKGKGALEQPAKATSNEPISQSRLPVVLEKPATRELAMVMEDADTEMARLSEKWAKDLQRVRHNVISVNRQYRQLMLKFISQAYGIYLEIDAVNWRDRIYENLRWTLYDQGIKTQRNTPDAALIIRYICGTDVPTKSVSDYTRVLEAAKRNQIEPKDFEAWIKQRTMTKVIEEQRHLDKHGENYEDRMRRARLLVMRLLEAREEMPTAVKTMSERAIKTTTAWHAEREWLNPMSSLWVAVGTARRRYDRESNSADVILQLLIQDTDLEFYIINYLAKHFVNNLDFYEQRIHEQEQKVWGEELWEYLISACDAESELKARAQAARQQASHNKLIAAKAKSKSKSSKP